MEGASDLIRRISENLHTAFCTQETCSSVDGHIKDVILRQQPSPFENLRSSYLQAKFIEENFAYVVRILVVSFLF